MEITIDNYGRVVIPKPMRERLGLEAGSALEITIEPADGGEALTLRPSGQKPTLARRDGILVHTGTLDEPLDPAESVRRIRAERQRTLTGRQQSRKHS